ncbi:methyltransferase family protein [Chthonobacter rhizosphaerae]|uniref:methyltransferase family protein n=1 Tax=Chthonobacter rhizosphaerae TaxID=2735553 RepID=UPI0015EF5CA9|nr:isoprenylcysteine carboxylmethyltransferase family protein [Chthonobacter rhizosphaerae]
MSGDGILRVFLACYFGYVAVHYTATLLALRMRTGSSRAQLGEPRSRNAVHQRIFRLFRAVILLVCVIRVPFPQVDAALLPFPYPGEAVGRWLGFAIMIFGLGLVDFAHAYLGPDWRSGLAGGPPRRLVTGGPYAASRNPIFAGILLGQAGFFLVLPSAFTLLCLVVGVTVILRQVALEEEALKRQFGPAYDDYRATTPRWIALRRHASRSDAHPGDPSAAL